MAENMIAEILLWMSESPQRFYINGPDYGIICKILDSDVMWEDEIYIEDIR